MRLSSLYPKSPEHAGQRSRDSLLRGLKHELRTPLNAILGFADLLLGELDGPLSADERENVMMVRQSGAALLTLINDVLDLATALVQPVEAVYEDVDLVALLELLRSELEQRRGLRLVYVRVDGPAEGLEARVDQRLVSRVLRCLGEVALGQTPAGEVVLGVGLGEQRLQLWVGADGFCGPGADIAALLGGQTCWRERARRIVALKLAIASRLLAQHGASLCLAGSLEQPALCASWPLAAAPELAGVAPASDADVSLALTYIAAMGHDLRTPLNGILGFADLLALEREGSWTLAQRRSFGIVRERALDLASLVDDMIDWAKLEAGELALAPEPTSLRRLLERVQSAATGRSGARGLKLEVRLGPLAELRLRADPARCVQAVLGLLDHAIRSDHGAAVQISVQRTAAGVELVVEDPGLEIRPEDQPGVFDAFRPSYAPTGQRIAGLQLGPSIARSLMRAHGGDVWFESRPGRGTTFTARLPISMAEEA